MEIFNRTLAVINFIIFRNTNFGVMDRKQKPAIRHTLQSNARLNDLENLFTEFKGISKVVIRTHTMHGKILGQF